MKAIQSEALLTQLQGNIRELLVQAEKLKTLNQQQLQQAQAPGTWSVAQVLEHLNIYARFYTNAIEEKINAGNTVSKALFKPGWLGNYFTKLMQPQDNTVKRKMKAPKNAVPAAQPDGTAMLQEFIHHQHQLLNLLQIARSVNLHIRIPISISRFILLKLGDTFRFVIAHQQRHFVQINNVLGNSGTFFDKEA